MNYLSRINNGYINNNMELTKSRYYQILISNILCYFCFLFLSFFSLHIPILLTFVILSTCKSNPIRMFFLNRYKFSAFIAYNIIRPLRTERLFIIN